jgi:seryl-tRNA synthetase
MDFMMKIDKWAQKAKEDKAAIAKEMDSYEKNDKNRFLWADLQWALMEWRKYKRAAQRAEEEQNLGAKEIMEQKEREWHKVVEEARKKLANWKENVYGDEEEDDDDIYGDDDEDTEE